MEDREQIDHEIDSWMSGQYRDANEAWRAFCEMVVERLGLPASEVVADRFGLAVASGIQGLSEDALKVRDRIAAAVQDRIPETLGEWLDSAERLATLLRCCQWITDEDQQIRMDDDALHALIWLLTRCGAENRPHDPTGYASGLRAGLTAWLGTGAEEE